MSNGNKYNRGFRCDLDANAMDVDQTCITRTDNKRERWRCEGLCRVYCRTIYRKKEYFRRDEPLESESLPVEERIDAELDAARSM